jgi:hypothetical protein
MASPADATREIGTIPRHVSTGTRAVVVAVPFLCLLVTLPLTVSDFRAAPSITNVIAGVLVLVLLVGFVGGFVIYWLFTWGRSGADHISADPAGFELTFEKGPAWRVRWDRPAKGFRIEYHKPDRPPNAPVRAYLTAPWKPPTQLPEDDAAWLLQQADKHGWRILHGEGFAGRGTRKEVYAAGG